jgi:hypothetical protein
MTQQTRPTVSTAPRKLAIIIRIEVLNHNSPAPIELEDLVIGPKSPTAIHRRSAGALLERRGVLADLGPPDVVERAGAAAVDALGLRRADNDVRERRAVLEDEHGRLFVGLCLA